MNPPRALQLNQCKMKPASVKFSSCSFLFFLFCFPAIVSHFTSSLFFSFGLSISFSASSLQTSYPLSSLLLFSYLPIFPLLFFPTPLSHIITHHFPLCSPIVFPLLPPLPPPFPLSSYFGQVLKVRELLPHASRGVIQERLSRSTAEGDETKMHSLRHATREKCIFLICFINPKNDAGTFT